ncbi:MAG: hypothetical protein AABX83_04265 [Nanoarchaeota archaeon]
MANQEDNLEIEETYRLNESKLSEIIQKINSGECSTILSDEEITISRCSIKGSIKENNVAKGIDIGRLIVGANIQAKNPNGLYLQTYTYEGEKGEANLVSLLREYIA